MVDSTVYVYVEGGGESNALRRECREGFSRFVEKAGFSGRMPRFVPCGPRQKTYRMFKIAVDQQKMAILLLDSEDTVKPGFLPWEHLANRPGDQLSKPDGVTDAQCHFMVVCMESWFLADKEALSNFFGQGFNAKLLPQRPDVEAISKADVYAGIERASANCKTKARYGKGQHSFKVLAMISPGRVGEASPWAKRFLDALFNVMNP